MAKKVQVLLVDDLDKSSPADETVSFSLDGVSYEIDLTSDNAAKLRDDLAKMTGREIHINIQEIQRPELDAQLVSESIAGQLERRVSFRRAMKKAMESAFRFGAKGVKIMVAGRLGGSEIARTEWYQEGRLPLHTLKADIDYGFAEARTTYGVIGCKVWVYKGDLLKEKSRRATA